VSDKGFLDLTLLEGYIESIGREIVVQMLELYIQQSKIYLEAISKASIGDSQTEWHDACHKMKGAAGSVGLKKVHAKLVVIENLTAGSALKRQEVIELKELNHKSIGIFQTWLKTVS
jgi:HPt (histidine-containing phosphotransfer) domain-containing protein